MDHEDLANPQNLIRVRRQRSSGLLSGYIETCPCSVEATVIRLGREVSVRPWIG